MYAIDDGNKIFIQTGFWGLQIWHRLVQIWQWLQSGVQIWQRLHVRSQCQICTNCVAGTCTGAMSSMRRGTRYRLGPLCLVRWQSW